MCLKTKNISVSRGLCDDIPWTCIGRIPCVSYLCFVSPAAEYAIVVAKFGRAYIVSPSLELIR